MPEKDGAPPVRTARLDALAGQGLRRIGLSATQRPIGEVARYLCGEGPCHIVDMGHRRAWDLGLVLPQSPLTALMSKGSERPDPFTLR